MDSVGIPISQPKYSIQNIPKLPISKLGCLTIQTLSVKKYSVQI
jgi:hypothetical protein